MPSIGYIQNYGVTYSLYEETTDTESRYKSSPSDWHIHNIPTTTDGPGPVGTSSLCARTHHGLLGDAGRQRLELGQPRGPAVRVRGGRGRGGGGPRAAQRGGARLLGAAPHPHAPPPTLLLLRRGARFTRFGFC